MASKKIILTTSTSINRRIEEWLRELEIWQCVTDLEKKKQGAVVYLSLTDKIRKSCNDISVRDLNKDDGLDTLVRKIKSLYAKDTNTLAFMAYNKFENFKRPNYMNTVDYINEFERLNNQIKLFDFFKNANISNEKQQLIQATTVTLAYDNVTRQLKAIFDSSTISTDSESIDVKSEPVFYVNKGTDGRYQDLKDSSRDGASQ